MVHLDCFCAMFGEIKIIKKTKKIKIILSQNVWPPSQLFFTSYSTVLSYFITNSSSSVSQHFYSMFSVLNSLFLPSNLLPVSPTPSQLLLVHPLIPAITFPDPSNFPKQIQLHFFFSLISDESQRNHENIHETAILSLQKGKKAQQQKKKPQHNKKNKIKS